MAGEVVGRIIIILFAIIGCVACPTSQSVAAKEGTKRLFCPPHWPEDAVAKLRKADFTELNNRTGPDEFGNPVRWGVGEGDEMSCVYDNGRRLLITIPGKPDTCFDGDRKNPKPGQLPQFIYCTFAPTGDPAKDAVNLREMEPLTRATLFHGVRLGMTSQELTDSLHPKSVSDMKYHEQIFLLSDMQPIMIGYEDGGAKVAQFRPPLGKTEGIFDEVRERFGFPDSFELEAPIIWYGDDGVRLVIYETIHFGWRGELSDERAFLLDANKLPGLDDQLKKESRD